MFYFQSKYKKQRAQTIAEFKGFQKMDPKEHPVVQMAARSAQLLDQVPFEPCILNIIPR